MKQLPLFLMFLFALQPPNCFAGVLSDISLTSTEKTATLLVSTDSSADPHVRFNPKEECWQMDLMDMNAAKTFFPVAPPTGPVKLMQVSQVFSVPTIQRISLFLKSEAAMKLRKTETGIEVIFKENTTEKKRTDSGHRPRPQPLLRPTAEKEEIVLEMKNTSTVALLSELARRAKLNLKFRDPPPRKTTIRTRCKDPKSAMEEVCRSIGMVLSAETDGWWITRQANPLLALPGDAEVDFRELEGLTMKQALKKICGEKENLLSRKFSDRLLGTPFCLSPRKVSPRTLVDQLLQSHGMGEEK